jgi:hypothetical protein
MNVGQGLPHKSIANEQYFLGFTFFFITWVFYFFFLDKYSNRILYSRPAHGAHCHVQRTNRTQHHVPTWKQQNGPLSIETNHARVIRRGIVELPQGYTHRRVRHARGYVCFRLVCSWYAHRRVFFRFFFFLYRARIHS